MLKWAATVSVISLALLLPAAAYSKPITPNVKFTATGPDGLNIVGEGDQLQVSADAKSLNVLVPLAAIHTGIDLRDRQLRERYLEVGKYPNAELKVARAALQFPELGATVERQAQGALSLHGRTKAVRFQYSARRDATGFLVTGTVRVNLREHGMELPEYLGVTVRANVDVTVHCHIPASVAGTPLNIQ